ncbi:hypothetical protein NEF87_000200 [Candidatus Lokiarchaeum ossiferum]|uniref:Uncharacterized protein n=1 Tax=Candidatus Lokiarchaeum ossiferum TaxID=2951803 RepID=A0ABY6HK67_9ARCH|nr:hypothetical protein NEF87_000200 [Candidatus Lokiarchaeum sp. B-35]
MNTQKSTLKHKFTQPPKIISEQSFKRVDAIWDLGEKTDVHEFQLLPIQKKLVYFLNIITPNTAFFARISQKEKEAFSRSPALRMGRMITKKESVSIFT